MITTKSLLLSLCVFILASCGQSIPPVTVGSGGFRVAGSGQNPEEIYNDEYARFSGNTIRLYYAIRSNPPNHTAAAGYVSDMIESLKIMRGLLVDDLAIKLQSYIQKYESSYELLITNRYNASTITDLDRSANEIKSSLSPSEVRLKESSRAQPQSETSPEPQLSTWIIYEAWDKTHQQLEQKWINSEDCESDYQKVIESLGTMKRSLAEKDQLRIQTCIDSYMNTYNKTNGLKEPPQGTTREEILNDLRAPASIIRQFYKPD